MGFFVIESSNCEENSPYKMCYCVLSISILS